MKTNYLIYKSPPGVRFAALILAAILLLMVLPSAPVFAAPRAVPAVDGDGAMTVSPTTAVYGSTGNTFTFTFTPTGGRDFEIGSSVRLTIPAGWTAPVMLTNVFVNEGTCSLNPSWTIDVSTIVVDIWSCLSGQSFTITYSGVTAPGFSGSPYTFLTETDVPNGNGIIPIASSPTVTITPATLAVSAAGLTPANKVYDGNTTAALTIGAPSLVGVIGSDSVSLVTTSAAGAFDTKDVGTTKTVYISGLTLGGLDAGNYTLTQPTRTADITAKPITVTADAGQTKVFGAADPAFAYTASDPLILGDSFSGALSRAAGENVGAYAIGQGTLSAGGNYSITFVSNDFTITAKPITVTANAGQTKVFGSADPLAFTYTSSDLGASFTGALSRAAGENVGAYAIGQGTLSAGGNYSITFVSDDFTITAKPITVTADAGQTKVFGAADPAFTYTSSDLGASFTGALNRAAGENVGAYAIGQGTLSAGGNYSITFVSDDFTITAKPITVTADAGQTKVFGAADPAFTYTSSDLGASFTGALSRAAGENVGAYAIGQGTLSAGGNYSITFVSDDFTITAKPITVTANAGQTKVFGSADPLAFTYTSSDLGASFTGALNRAAGENVGAYAIGQGTLSAGGNYSITFVSDDFTITAKPITVTADAGQTKVFGSADPLAFTYTSSDLGASFTGALNRAAGENVGAYAIGQGTLSAGGNYSITFVSDNLVITQASLTATANNKSKIFRAADPVFDVSYTGFKFTDTEAVLDVTPTCVVSVPHLAIGLYPITCSGGLDNNYVISHVNGTLTVLLPPSPIFVDVPLTYWSASFIERLYGAGITSGCSTVPLNYCPDNSVTRAQMAIFLLKGIHGMDYTPPAVGGSTGFADVAANHWAAAWIKQLAVEGITNGCGGGNYCPDGSVTRAQMAVFLVRARHGSGFAPPAATGLFADVLPGSFGANFIEQLYAEGITTGCGTAPLRYCPDGSVTRAQMAVFLVRTFNLP